MGVGSLLIENGRVKKECPILVLVIVTSFIQQVLKNVLLFGEFINLFYSLEGYTEYQ